MTNEQFEFQPGDKVKCAFFGDEVFELRGFDDNTYFICFTYKECIWSFTKDGRYNVYHTHPVLILVERPKKKVTKTVKTWANVYPDNDLFFYVLKEQAESLKLDGCIATVEMTGSYEAEE